MKPVSTCVKQSRRDDIVMIDGLGMSVRSLQVFPRPIVKVFTPIFFEISSVLIKTGRQLRIERK